MLRIRVLSQMGRPLVVPLVAVFDGAGGTIGRSPDCTLVLPSPGKHISRRQAQIVADSDGFGIVATGSSTPLILNGVELPANRTARLRPGDRMLVAEYELCVESTSAEPSAAGAGGADNAASRRFPSSIPDDFDPFGMPPRGPGDAANPPPMPRADARADARAGDPLVAHLPDPFDPFAVSPVRAAATATAPPAATPNDPLGIGGAFASSLDPGRRSAESIDSLFGLAPGERADPLAIGAPLGDRLPSQRLETSLDPLAPFAGGTPAAPLAPVPDHTPEIHGSMRLPEAIPPTTFGMGPAAAPDASRDAPVLSWTVDPAPAMPAARGAGQVAAPRPTPVVAPSPVARAAGFEPPPAAAEAVPTPASYLPDDMVRSIAERAADSRRAEFAALPKTRPTELLDRLNNEQLQALASTSGARVAQVGSRDRSDVPAADPVRARATGHDAELLAALTQAFLAGAGIAELPRLPGHSAPAMLTPDMMRRLGELMRLVAQGTVDLLAARATLKHEMRADVTRISASDNNPLKFAPDAPAALAHLLAAAPPRGFMAPVPALEDAYRDLLAHQIAFVAGVRAAMQGLIARFDPESLEARLTRKAVIDSMLPIGRRARLWELFIELYGDISREAEDDFDALFGRAFVEAYEAQSARLRER